MNTLKVKTYRVKTGEQVVCYVDPVTKREKERSSPPNLTRKITSGTWPFSIQSRGPRHLTRLPLVAS
jgi:hypothetical protein